MTDPNASASGAFASDPVSGTNPTHPGAGSGAPSEAGASSVAAQGASGGSETDAFAAQVPVGVEALLTEAQARASEYMDRALRAQADLENLRKRSQQDIAAAHKFAIERFAESLLAVHDSLEMALKVDAPSLDNLREGVQATLRQLSSAFERNKLLAIDPVGQKFDPNQHQAIAMVPAPGVAANTVVAVMQKGFLINERVLRPAMVTVSNGQG